MVSVSSCGLWLTVVIGCYITSHQIWFVVIKYNLDFLSLLEADQRIFILVRKI